MKRKYVYILAATAIIALAALLEIFFPQSGTTVNPENDPVRISVDKIVNEQIKNNKDSNFNGIIMVAKDGKELYQYASGYANYEKKEMIDADTSFGLGSISKQFTAMGAMILYEQGKIGLDDSITKYLPELDYKDVTIRHLMTHTSGLPEYISATAARKSRETPVTNEDLVNTLKDKKVKLMFEPGEKFAYANTSYGLLAIIIERVSGQSLAEFLNDNIFKPLDMKGSVVYDIVHDPAINKRAYGYGRDGEFTLDDVTHMDGMTGFTNQYSSANDLLKWDAALHTEKLVKRKTLNMIYTPYKLNDGKSAGYGFGWYIDGAGKNIIANHSGAWNGFHTWIARDTGSGYTIICLTNVPPNDSVNKTLGEIYGF